jgi:excisionase family DNA binding protein
MSAEAWAAGWQAGYEQARIDIGVAVLNAKQSKTPAAPKRFTPADKPKPTPQPKVETQPISDGIDRLNDIDIVQVKLGGIGRTKLYRLIKDGELKSVKIGKRRFIPDSAIAAYIEGLQ